MFVVAVAGLSIVALGLVSTIIRPSFVPLLLTIVGMVLVATAILRQGVVESDLRVIQSALRELFHEPRHIVSAIGFGVAMFGILCSTVTYSPFAILLIATGMASAVVGLRTEIMPEIKRLTGILRTLSRQFKEQSAQRAEERKQRPSATTIKTKDTEESNFPIIVDESRSSSPSPPVEPEPQLIVIPDLIQSTPQEPDRVPCPYCGEFISPMAIKCRHCNEFLDGRAVIERIPREIIVQQPENRTPAIDERLRCPWCNSPNLSANTKGFSVGKAFVGGCLLWPIAIFGLLFGFLGSKRIKITCLSCGYKFNPGQGRNRQGGGCLKGCLTLVIFLFIAVAGLLILTALVGPPLPKAQKPQESAPEQPAPVIQEQTENEGVPVPFKFHDRAVDESGDVMELYIFSGQFDQTQLNTFCEQERRKFEKSHKTKRFYYIIFFDNQRYAAFPTNPFSAGFIEDKYLKHIQAEYGYNFVNDWSELTVFNPNALTGKPNIIK